MEVKCIYLLCVCMTHLSAVFLCVLHICAKQASEAGLLQPEHFASRFGLSGMVLWLHTSLRKIAKSPRLCDLDSRAFVSVRFQANKDLDLPVTFSLALGKKYIYGSLFPPND